MLKGYTTQKSIKGPFNIEMEYTAVFQLISSLVCSNNNKRTFESCEYMAASAAISTKLKMSDVWNFLTLSLASLCLLFIGKEKTSLTSP